MSSLLIKSSSSNIHHRLSSSRLQSEKRQQQQKQQQFGLDKNASDFKLKKIIEKDDDNNNIVLYPSLSSLPLTSSTTTSTSTSTLTPLLSTFSSANNIASHRNSLISLTKMITTIMAVCILVMTIEQPIQCVSISSLKLPISSSSSSSSTTDSGANDGNSILTKRSIPFNGNFDNQQQQQQSDWTHPLAISQRPLEACQQIISAILTRDLASKGDNNNLFSDIDQSSIETISSIPISMINDRIIDRLAKHIGTENNNHHNHNDNNDDYEEYHNDLLNSIIDHDDNSQNYKQNEHNSNKDSSNSSNSGSSNINDSNNGKNDDNPITVDGSIDRGQQQQQQQHSNQKNSNQNHSTTTTTISTPKTINSHVTVHLIKKCIQLVIDNRHNHQEITDIRPSSSSSSQSSLREKKSWFFGQPNTHGHNHIGRINSQLKENSDSLYKSSLIKQESSSIAERLDSYWKDLKGIRYKKHNGKIVQIKSRKHRNSANSRKDSRVNKRMILFLLNLSIAKPLLEKIQSKEQLKRLEDALKMSEHIQEKKQDKSELKSMPTSSSSSSYEYHDNLHPSSLTPFDVDSLKSFEIDSNENIDVSQQSPISMEMNRNSDEDSSSLYDTNGENFYTLSPQSFPSSKTSMMTSATMKITTPVSTKTNRHPHHQHQHHHLHHHQDDTATTTGIDETASQSSRLLETDRPMLETPRSKKLLSQTMILRANPWDKEGIRFKRSSQTTEQNDNFFQPHFDQQNENTNTEPNLSILDLLHPTGIRYKKSPFDDEGIRYKKSPFDDEGIRYKKSPFDDEGIRYKKSPFDDEGIRYKKSPFDDEGIRYKKAPHMFNDEGIRY